jgi:hypothetical protein
MRPAIKNALGLILCMCAVALFGLTAELWTMVHCAQQPAARVGVAMDWWFDCHRSPTTVLANILENTADARRQS